MGRPAARGAIAAIAALVAAGCGGSHLSTQQKAVTAYLDDVNRIDRAMVPAVQRVNTAYNGFRAGKKLPSASQLRTAERTILILRDQVASLDPPAAALPIHRDLLRLFTDDALVAHELTAMAIFLPPFQKSGAPFVAARRELSAGLRAAKKPAAEAAVLDRYVARCRAGLAALRALTPPAVLAPLYDSRVAHLQKSASLSTQLAAALRRGDRPGVRSLGARLQALEGGVEERIGAKAEAIAVAGYSRRLGDISTLETRINRELTALQTR